MCMELFVASAVPLPLIAYKPGVVFSAQLPLAGSEAVLRLFSKPYVYDLSSIGGCACGFSYGPWDLDILSEADVPAPVKEKEVADYAARRESVHLLKEYLRLALGTDTIQVYSCWIGDEEAEPETRLDVTLDCFGGDAFGFSEKQFLTVHLAEGEPLRPDSPVVLEAEGTR